MAIDPVCGMQVDENQARELGLSAEHNGQEYFFCSEACRQAFAVNPARFLTVP
jgi:Cu+-exporting ATPase